jgi:FtsP/CotA-like multicopper oxidase with cupredoxin domain
MKYKLSFGLLALLIILSACSSKTSTNEHAGHNMNDVKEESEQQPNKTNAELSSQSNVLTGKEFTLVAKEVNHQLNEETTVPAWTFNGSVPGSEIRVKLGDTVKINLKNELPDPVTIHWHGVPVPNNMDGIPGVTMNAVQPGEAFTYEFKATVPGTYWYHSHQDGVNQLDKGLYGSFIIEDPNDQYDRDYTVIVDEWMSMPQNEMADSEEMGGMDHSSMENDGKENETGMDHSTMDSDSDESGSMGHDMGEMYDIYTINGKSGESVQPIVVTEGEKVKLRLINAGFMSHKIHLHGHDFKVTSTDGQPINNPQIIQDQLLSIAPGERYDIEFIADNPGEWLLECHGDMDGTPGMKLNIQYENSSVNKDKENDQEELPLFDLTSYGKSKNQAFTLDQQYDLEYTMELNTEMEGEETVYTINGKTFPETENLEVKTGELVKVKLVNNSKIDEHPMHLHGHFFQVLSKDGKPLAGSPVVKDTLNVKPGEEYIIAFKADNQGNWMFHCHDLHHASAGMVTELRFTDYKSSFTPDPSANNKPE